MEADRVALVSECGQKPFLGRIRGREHLQRLIRVGGNHHPVEFLDHAVRDPDGDVVRMLGDRDDFCR